MLLKVAVISAPSPCPRPGSGSVVLGAACEEVVDDLVQELLESGVFRPRNRLDPAVDGGQQVVAAAKAGAQLDALRGWICGGAAFRLAGAEREELAATLRVEHQRQAEVRVLGGVLVGGQAQDAALQRRFHGRDDVALQVLAGAEGVAGEFQVERPAVARSAEHTSELQSL